MQLALHSVCCASAFKMPVTFGAAVARNKNTRQAQSSQRLQTAQQHPHQFAHRRMDVHRALQRGVRRVGTQNAKAARRGSRAERGNAAGAVL
ncbi:hypothetical protein BURKHO8Y_180132 [Burkholderia sp. 8Y]|uniref:hypothetical protein n=1 Tax=Burkholderia sp. 8Y TaxID=2653133 RepID=UPI0012EF8971|nr:hypothetical protein [Burkholderia sp. 8Y]VXC05085.1 hypothetical protein BURKHO8Y_180132 [Burkholderia sp. 8Y]